MELPNLPLNSAQALSVSVQRQGNVLLTDTTALARLKQISAEGKDGAGGKTKRGTAQKTSTWVFSGSEILGNSQQFLQEEEGRGLRRKVTQKHPRLTYCVMPFLISPWRNGTEEAYGYGNSTLLKKTAEWE